MIEARDGVLALHTRHTSYILGQVGGLVHNLYYGARIRLHDAAPLQTKAAAGFGCDTYATEGQPALSGLCLELSPHLRGDYRAGALVARMPHGGFESDYHFAASLQSAGSTAPHGGMPGAHGGDDTLTLTFTEPSGLGVEMFYTVFEETDVITRRMRITNNAATPVELRRALSSQLDLPACDFNLFTLHGAWGREAHIKQQNLAPGTLRFGSNTGPSSNCCNPFFFLARTGAGEDAGEVYGFNLVYSGCHEASVEVDNFGRTRVLQGIQSEDFSWTLAPGESFVTPEAVLTFSAGGKNGMSQNMHRFVNRHIVPTRWQNTERPVLVNNWEGTYFRFNETKLLRIANAAQKLGIELFVLDDGWFGERNSDKAGLGDYNVNRSKLPGGLAALAEKLNHIGLQFGLWLEPEMTNADSELYRTHPDWIVSTPGYTPCTGRNQYVLDLCRPEVRRYVIDQVNRVLDSANISYIKWDMNRNHSDNFSPVLQNQGEFNHRFTLGLYELFENICVTHPDVLFEGCASGGNRFDLGMLCYMPQIWASDDSDAHERQMIQTGLSYGYPQSTIGAHVSAVPNHQTLRKTPLDTRYNTAVFGVLGYELDLTQLTQQQRKDVRAQVAFYKEHRTLLQYGNFTRLQSPFESTGTTWQVTSENRREAMVGDFYGLLVPNAARPPLRLADLDPEMLYTLTVRGQTVPLEAFGGLVNFVSPVHLNPDGKVMDLAGKLYRLPTEHESYTAYGSLLMHAGVKLKQDFSGAGFSNDMRPMTDFASRLFFVRIKEE